ncbi:MAG: glucose 1-dehydrogenase [Actinomycetota bacterium]
MTNFGGGTLDGKVAIITGASRGQGEAEARLFVDEGAKVLLTDVLDEQGAAVADELGDAAVYRRLDVTDEESWTAAVGVAVDRWGRLDVLVNNAGIGEGGPIEFTTLESYRRVVDVNQIGVFLGMRSVIAPMRDSGGGGSIVNISSVDGMLGMAWVVAYVASKFAVRGMSKTAAIELGQYGIRVNSVHPGGVDTPMIHPEGFEGFDPGVMFTKIPLGRIGMPADIARVVLFLASDASGYVTGTELVVDGGLIAGVNIPGAPI